MDSLEKILLKRSLNKNGNAQKFFTHEIRRLSDPYIPMATGTMKNTAIESVDHITYPQIYAKSQFYGNRGNGLRGARWTGRMWADRGTEIVKSVARYAGGHT